MWERMADEIVAAGGELALGSPVTAIRFAAGGTVEVEAGGEILSADAAISSLPLRTVAGLVEPSAPRPVLEAAAGLRYRDFVCVALVLDGPEPFPDNWIYVHDPDVRVGRIQNFRAWSPDLVPEPDRTCLGLEYFCFEGDELWDASDAELVAAGIGGARDARARRARRDRHRARRARAEGLPDLRLRATSTGSRPCAAGSMGSTGWSRLAATGSTATTTPTTRC